MVILGCSIGYQTGWVGLVCAFDYAFEGTLKDKDFHISDSPEPKLENRPEVKDKNASRRMKSVDYVEFKEILEEQFCYKVDTSTGQSGSGNRRFSFFWKT